MEIETAWDIVGVYYASEGILLISVILQIRISVLFRRAHAAI